MPGYPFADTFWGRLRVDDAPLDPDQDPAADIARQVRDHYNGIAGVNNNDFNTNIHVLPDGDETAPTTLQFDDCQDKGAVPPEMINTDGTGALQDVPLPPTARPVDGTDGEYSLLHDGKLWEFWQLTARQDGTHAACWAGRMDLATDGGVFPDNTGATATSLPMAALVLTPADVEHAQNTGGGAGHMLGFTAVQTREGQHSWPATRTDGFAPHPAPEEGRIFRLDPSLDVDSLGLTPFAAIAAKTAQTNGLVLYDKAGAVTIPTSTDDQYWDTLFAGTPSHEQLRDFPWDQLQQLPHNWGKHQTHTTAPAGDTPPPPKQEDTPTPPPAPSTTATNVATCPAAPAPPADPDKLDRATPAPIK